MYYGGFQQPRIRRIPKSAIKQYIISQIMATGIRVNRVINLSELPDTLRHSCMPTGITFLPKHTIPVQQPEGMMEVTYYYCNQCGNVYIDSMNVI